MSEILHSYSVMSIVTIKLSLCLRFFAGYELIQTVTLPDFVIFDFVIFAKGLVFGFEGFGG